MLKRWAGWPPGIRWLVGIAAVALGLAVVWALFVPIADWLAHHDVGSVKGSLHETAMDNARGRLLTLAAGVAAAGALAFTALNFTLSRRTFELTEQGQVTDRYAKAVEQLGSDKIDVRIGGIYALERIARDSARDHPTVMEVLTAFIREHSKEYWPPTEPGGQEQERLTRPDVEAALTVVGRRDQARDIQPIDLISANLTSANLAGAHLNGALLNGAFLTRADVHEAFLSGAFLSGADLTDALLDRAHLDGVDFTGAFLDGAFLSGADLTAADFTGADLPRAHLDGADLRRADFRGANLAEADFHDAVLTGARWPEDAPVPEGWKRNTRSGRLEAASAESGPPGVN